MKLSPRNTLIIVVVLAAVVVVALAALLVFPQFSRLAGLDADVQQEGQNADAAQALLAQRQEAKSNAAVTDTELLQLTAGVPETPDLPSLIIELQDLAYESNVILAGVDPEDQLEARTGYVAMPITVTVWGDWADNVDFIQQLERISRQVRVVSVETEGLSTDDIESQPDVLEQYAVGSEILMETYMIPPTGSAGTTATPVR